MLVEVGRAEQALDCIDTALAEHPDNIRLQIASGWLLLRLQRSADAQRILEQAIVGSPDIAHTRVLLSCALQNRGLLAEARSAVEQALELRPDDSAALMQHADLLTSGRVRKADRDLALARIDQALELEPENPSRLLGSAAIHARLGDVDTARRLVHEGLAVAPDHEDLLFADAQLSVDAGHKSRALIGILAQNPEHAEAGYALFTRLWHRVLAPVDTAIFALTGITLAIAWLASDTLIDSLIAWPLILGAFLGLSILMSWAALYEMPRMLVRRSLFDRTPTGSGGSICGLSVLAGAVVALIALPVMHDAVAIRWYLVVLALLLVLAGVTSVMLRRTLLRHGRESGYFTVTELGLKRVEALRSRYRKKATLRAALTGLVAFFALSLAAGTARPDALPVAVIGAVAWLLPLVVSIWSLRDLETRLRRDVADLPEARRTHGPTRATAGVAVLIVSTLVLGAGGLVAVAHVPVLPNEYDADGRYTEHEDTSKPESIDPSSCVGTLTGRTACRTRELRDHQRSWEEKLEDWDDNRERLENPLDDLPTYDIPTFDADMFDVPSEPPGADKNS